MKMYDEKPSYREAAIRHLKENTLCRGYIDYFVGELEKLEKIEQIIKDHDNDKLPEDYWYIDKIREVVLNNERNN